MNNLKTTVGSIFRLWFAFLFCLGINLFWHNTLEASDRGQYASANQINTYQREKASSYNLVASPKVSYFGVIPKVFTMKRPLELVNPLAASCYGYGRDTVSWSAREGKPKGFIVAGVRFW